MPNPQSNPATTNNLTDVTKPNDPAAQRADASKFFGHLVDNFTSLIRKPTAAPDVGTAFDWKGKLYALEDSDIYQSATPDKRIAMETLFFNKFIKPRNPSMDLKEWLSGRGQVMKMRRDPASDFSKFYLDAGNKITLGVASGVTDVAKSARDKYDAARQAFNNIKTNVSLGEALLNPQVAPYVKPDLFSKEHLAVKASNPSVPVLSQLSGMKLDELYKASEYAQENYYQNTLKEQLLYKEGGKLVAQTPLFMASDGILEGLGVHDILGVATAKGVKGLAAKSIYNGMQGYLIGTATGEGATKSAAGFAVGTALVDPPLRMFGKLVGWGGGKLATQVLDYTAKRSAAKSAETVISPVGVALGGTEKQKISAATVKAVLEMTGGRFAQFSDEAKKEVLTKLAAQRPDLAKDISFIDKNIVGIISAEDMIKQRGTHKEFDEILTTLEKFDKEPTHKTVADSVAAKSEAEAIRRKPEVLTHSAGEDEVEFAKRQGQPKAIAPGAAKKSSLEFEENMSRHIDDRLGKMGLGNYKFEDRKHKFLFFLNVLMSDQRRLGASKERNKTFDFLMRHLQTMFPGDAGRLPNLIEHSDKIWNDIETLTKAGVIKEGEDFRYWRQHSAPGQSPFAWEQEALKKAQAHDKLEEIASKQVSQLPPGQKEIKTVKDIPSPISETEEQAQNRKLKEAFAKTSATHETDLQKAVKKLYPGKTFAELTSEERIRAVNVSLGKDPDFKGGK